MNRLNMNNINEAITSDMEFKQQDPFLLFRNKKSKYENLLSLMAAQNIGYNMYI